MMIAVVVYSALPVLPSWLVVLFALPLVAAAWTVLPPTRVTRIGKSVMVAVLLAMLFAGAGRAVFLPDPCQLYGSGSWQWWYLGCWM